MLGIVDKITRFEIVGVPLGNAARGHVASAVADTAGALIIRFAPASLTGQPYSMAALKLGLAALCQVKQVKGFLGNESANIASLILTYEGLGSIYNIRGKLNNILSGLAGKALPSASPAATPSASGASSIVIA